MSRHDSQGQRSAIILGGGPAGVAVAISLAQHGWRVLLLSRPRPARARLGEIVSPQSRILLGQIGLSDFEPTAHVVASGIVSAWGSDELYQNDFLFMPPGSGWIVDREQFDDALGATAQRSGVAVRNVERLQRARRHSCGWEISWLEAEQEQRAEAAFAVDATGRAGWLTKRQRARRMHFDRQVALVAVFARPGADQASARALIEASQHGWWYSSPAAGDRQVVMYFSDWDLVPSNPLEQRLCFDHELRATKHTHPSVASQRCIAGPKLVLANSYACEHCAGEDWIAVGDAAVAYDPLSSQGIGKALRNGIQAAETLEALRADDSKIAADYTRTVHDDFQQFLAARHHYYSLEVRWPTSPYWQRRARQAELARA